MAQSQFPASFLHLQQEGYLIRSCLTTGLTELRSAHVHNKGAFYAALFNLSIGMERLLKANVIIDHMLNNNISSPSKKELKGYGHEIVDLYDTCKSISVSRGVDFPIRSSLDAINQEILILLNDFANNTTRYHNLDALSSSQSGKDPLLHWGEILKSILENDVSEKQREKVLKKACLASEKIDDISITIMQGMDKRPLSTMEAMALPGLHEQAAKYAVFRVVTILTPIRNLISGLSHETYGLGVSRPPIPQMQEFLEWLWDDRQYVLRKKRWP